MKTDRSCCIVLIEMILLAIPQFMNAEVHHNHHAELGFSPSYVYIDAEKESAAGMHLHFERRLEFILQKDFNKSRW